MEPLFGENYRFRAVGNCNVAQFRLNSENCFSFLSCSEPTVALAAAVEESRLRGKRCTSDQRAASTAYQSRMSRALDTKVGITEMFWKDASRFPQPTHASASTD